jgi:CheY-like chemotaxis protein
MSRVLVVDDDKAIAQMVARIVEFCGHEPTVVLDSTEVLVNHQRGYAAAVVDYLMPKLTGIELLACIQETSPECRRILVTAAPEERPVRDSVASGIVQLVIAKPPTIGDFERALAWLK